MDKYSRIIIEEYCMSHNSKKSRRIRALLEMSYDWNAMATDDDAIF